MTEKEKAEIKKIEAETRNIHHNIALKWFGAISALALGGTPLIKIIEKLLH